MPEDKRAAEIPYLVHEYFAAKIDPAEAKKILAKANVSSNDGWS